MATKLPEFSPFDASQVVLTGYTVIVVALGGLLVWACLAPLAAAVVATGQLTPEGSRKTIQHLEGGIIKAIRVREGDLVQAGDVLIQLESEEVAARASAIRSKVDRLRAVEARLVSEEQDRASIDLPRELLGRRTEPEVDDLLRWENRILQSRRSARQQKVAALNGETEQIRKQMSGLDAQHLAATTQLAILEEELSGLRRLYQQGFGWESRMRAFQRESEKLRGDAAKMLTDKAAAEARIQQIRAEIAKTVQEFHEQTATERQQATQQLREAEQELRAVTDSVRRLDVIASYAGRVLNLRKHAVAGVVAPGEPLLDIVPLDERLSADVRIAPQDIDQVQVGQRAMVLFPTLNRRQTPNLAGEIEVVSADRLVDTATNVPYYLARVKILEGSAEKLGQFTLKPGLPLEVHIQTGSRSALSYLLKPLTDQFKRAMIET